MPLRKRLVWEVASNETGPLPVIFVLESGERLYCTAQAGRNGPIFHITLVPGRLPMPSCLARLKPIQHPTGLVSVCAKVGGHTHIDAGQMVTLTYHTKDRQSKTIEAGVVVDFIIP